MTVAAALWSGSRHIINASLVAGGIWLGSVLSWLMRWIWGVSDAGLWRYAILNIVALTYFYMRWSAPSPQHQKLHFLLMWSYLITTFFYVYQLWVTYVTMDAFGISPWWYQLVSNILFEAVLLLILVYALLYKYAQRNKAKYLANVDRMFAKAGEIKDKMKKRKPDDSADKDER